MKIQEHLLEFVMVQLERDSLYEAMEKHLEPDQVEVICEYVADAIASRSYEEAEYNREIMEDR